MRLLDVHRFPPPVPGYQFHVRKYAILSHVWEEEEFVFADLQRPPQTPANSDKVVGAQAQARRDGLDYVWIDTLCIDKSSSSELGEAINSMYRWYQDAQVCYVYLADLDGCPRLTDADILRSGSTADHRYWGALFKESKWFRRGWTLQELIAPKKIRFYDKSWNLIGTLHDLAATVSEITNIHLSMLRHDNTPEDFSIAQRMSWAAGRETTRAEDRAYSLLGILDLTVSIRYGEGSHAFIRLQEAIIAKDADQSIFAWEKPLVREEDVYLKDRRDSYLWYDPDWSQLLASSPDAFANSRNIVPSLHTSLPYRLTNIGLYITSSVPEGMEDCIILNCHYKDDPTKAILLNIRREKVLNIRSEEAQGQLPPETIAHIFLRERSADNRLLSRLTLLDVDQAHSNTKPHTFYISRNFAYEGDAKQPCKVWLQLLDTPEGSLKDMQPPLVSHLDFIPPPPKLNFQTSYPPPDNHTTNVTWTLDTDLTTHLQHQRIMMYLRHSGSANGPVELHLCLTKDRAFLAIVVSDDEDPKNRLESMVSCSKNKFAMMKPLDNQLFIEPGLAVRAALLRQHFNGQDMYVVKVCSVRTKVKRWGFKKTWRRWFRMTVTESWDGGCAPG
jgi:hypothetical protein